MLMNSFWSLLDWLLPTIRLPPDDLFHDDPEALSSSSHHHHSPSYLYPANTIHSYALPSTHLRIRDSTPSITPSYPPPVAPNASSTQHQILASNRGGGQQEGPKGRDKDRSGKPRDKERVREVQESEQRLERERQLKEENEALRRTVDKLTRDLNVSRENERALKQKWSLEYTSSPSHYPDPSSDTTKLRNAYHDLFSSQRRAQDLLSQRTKEVAALEKFLSKNDDRSGSQVINAVNVLNYEISSLAASLADEFMSPSTTFAQYRAEPSPPGAAQQFVSSIIGVKTTEMLLARDYTGDPTTVLQHVIQAWEVICIGEAMSSFCYGLSDEVDQFLARVFRHMHETEPQPMVSRWRAMTYAHTRDLLSSSSKTSPFHALIEQNARGLWSILALCNFASLPRDSFLEHCGARLQRISEAAEELASVVKEGMMSGEFELLWVNTAGLGEGNSRMYEGSWMDDVYSDHDDHSSRKAHANGREDKTVICSLAFGLMLTTKKGGDVREGGATTNGRAKENGVVNGNGHTNGHRRSESSFTRNVLIKPVVLLDTVWRYMERPKS